MTDEYQPIDCELYSNLEMWIMHRERLRIAWRDNNGGDHIGVVVPQDLRAESGEEYLYFSRNNARLATDRVRLDHILRVDVCN